MTRVQSSKIESQQKIGHLVHRASPLEKIFIIETPNISTTSYIVFLASSSVISFITLGFTQPLVHSQVSAYLDTHTTYEIIAGYAIILIGYLW